MNSRTHRYLLFADVKNFSKLGANFGEGQFETFFTKVMPEATKYFAQYENNDTFVGNTWGDGVFVSFSDPEVFRAALAFRDWFRNEVFEQLGLPTLAVRIACHFGPVFTFRDPLTGRQNVGGTSVNMAARLEPVTRANEIFVSQECKRQIEQSNTGLRQEIAFDELGAVPLAKSFGTASVFVLRRASENTHILDRLNLQNLDRALPDAPPAARNEAEEIRGLRTTPGDALHHAVNNRLQSYSPRAIVDLAKTCKDRGAYEEALRCVAAAESAAILADGLTVHPVRFDPKLRKVKANALTRLGRYEEALDVIYSLWTAGPRNDPDTLCMVAAQYKRRGCYEISGAVRAEPDTQLLERARDLYLEALRLNIEDFYPGLNAAYLHVMLRDRAKGRKLAVHFADRLQSGRGPNAWWEGAAVAECALLDEEYESACHKMVSAISAFHPTPFERAATREQIELFGRIAGVASECSPICTVLL